MTQGENQRPVSTLRQDHIHTKPISTRPPSFPTLLRRWRKQVRPSEQWVSNGRFCAVGGIRQSRDILECPIWRGQSWHLVMGARCAANRLNCTARPPCPRKDPPCSTVNSGEGEKHSPGVLQSPAHSRCSVNYCWISGRWAVSFSKLTLLPEHSKTLSSISTFLTLLRGFLFFVELTLSSPLSGTLWRTKIRQMMSLPARNSGLAGKRND